MYIHTLHELHTHTTQLTHTHTHHTTYTHTHTHTHTHAYTHTHTHAHTHQVYCRLRPLKEDEIESCADVIGDTQLRLTPPECSLAFKSGHRNGVCNLCVIPQALSKSVFLHILSEGV